LLSPVNSKTDAKKGDRIAIGALLRSRSGFRFDVTQKGNANGGHSYGTELSEPDKRALIEAGSANSFPSGACAQR
jgi:hypothetical protein